MTVFVTFDGPKGVGKSTLIGEVRTLLLDAGWTVSSLVEKDLLRDLAGAQLDAAHGEARNSPGRVSEARLATRYREARVVASKAYLDTSTADIILLDRWYPSDAVFREHIDHMEMIRDNVSSGVRRPDIAFAITCDAAVSWGRAHGRSRRLDSRVISSFAEHEVSTARFELMADLHAWNIVRTDHETPKSLGLRVVDEISKVLVHQ